jgi:hypothetical protein
MFSTPQLRWLAVSAGTISVLSLGISAAAQDEQAASGSLDDVSKVRRQGNVEGIESQKRVDDFSDKTDTLFAKYSTTLKQIDSIGLYNHQMRGLIASQEAEVASLEDQLDRVELVGRSVTPLMRRMIDAIEAFVSLDVPFLKRERGDRIAALRTLMRRADVSNAEKYRSIMEAYQIENEYGRTIEAYRSTIERGGDTKTVDFLRFGRLVLVYQTLDGDESSVWDQQSREWVLLDGSYRSSIRAGLRIARKQLAPDLIRLPLTAAQTGGEAD